MRRVLRFAAVAEGVTGLALMLAPSLVSELLLGEPLAGLAVMVGRVAGMGLVGLALACWPGPPLAGMLAYSGLVAVYLLYEGLAGAAHGLALWPAVVLHVVLTGLLARALAREK